MRNLRRIFYVRKISAVLSGVDHVFLFDAGKHLIHEFLTFDSGDAEVVVKVIAAHFGLRGRDFFVKVRHILIAQELTKLVWQLCSVLMHRNTLRILLR